MPMRLNTLSAVSGIVFALGFAVVSQGAVADAATVTTAVPAEVMEEGAALYKKNCRFCHGTNGTSGKRLAGNEMLADSDYVATVILTGPGYMTPFEEHLSDEEIALITTYVRNAWGHAYGPMQADDVAQLR
ncbi:c-type cytochrome [Ruegeria marina]|uniref:Cytochrome c, mono-and diheme variants n=1 Tax=Ruegeria marina TaxID=639004 RepID=A0A1G6ZQE6_9RHOB|nr:cytochrome c [Ruegeria marina]SDE03776.1 Cytochrome c, mono-and diheme variants [Ruegeria marina]